NAPAGAGSSRPARRTTRAERAARAAGRSPLTTPGLGPALELCLQRQPQVLAGREAAAVDGGGGLAAHVAVVPRLVDVAGHVAHPLRVAHDEAVDMGVRRDPGALRRGRPVLELPGGRARVGAEVDGRAELVLGVAGAGAAGQRGLV